MEKPPDKERATDMAVAKFLIFHIENPCEDLQGNNIRGFYIREARRILPSFTDDTARHLLEAAIVKYS